MDLLVNEEEVEWQDHATVKGAKIKVLQSKEQGALATTILVSMPKGPGIPAHVHEGSDDIVYVLKGRAKMEIEGIGSFDLKKGSCMRVPKDTKHRIHDVTEDLLQYNVFAPATR